MAQVPILMPQLGESIAEATIVKVLFQEGSAVEADKDVIEVETNKAVMGVTSPCTGEVSQILIQEGQSYPVGAVLGYVEVSAEEARRLGIEEEPQETPRRKEARRPTRAAPRGVE
ncbi:MAG: lipoyl domain-containing protein, partial [Terrimicrobiaceae bacterium]